jgi:hypothetical protein
MTKTQNKSEDTQAREDLERQILYGLSLEYEQALFYLDQKTASKIKKPLFRLSVTQHQLGSWHASKREISISRNFAFSHSWDIIREVLLHEMAHQLADEVLGGYHETAHGQTFQKACKLLRANPRASGDYPNFNIKNQDDSINRRHRLLGRVKKLMTLSSSKNKHEAAAAMAKAHELILKHNLPLLKRHQIASFTTMFLGQPALRHYREDYLLAHLLMEFYFVEGLWVASYVINKEKMGRVFEISGRSTNIEIAAYVYDCVHNYIEKQWKSYSLGQKLGRHQKSDFATGIITGFHQKLENERYPQALKPDEKALILRGDPHLKAYLKYRYPHTRSIAKSRAAMDQDIYTQGTKRGRHLSLMKGLRADSASIRLIE